jgi:hypothetical protein
MGFLKAFGRFWYDFVVGDDWKIAAYVAAVLTGIAALAVVGGVDDWLLCLVGTVAIAGCFLAGVRFDARRSSR